MIIIVACFVLGTKRTAAFESTLLTAIGGGAGGGCVGNSGSSNGMNGNGARQGSLANGTLCHGLMGTPVHHGTPLNHGGGSGCDSEPRYGTVTTSNTTAYEHYGFTTAQPGSNGGVGPTFDTFHLSIMGDGGRGKGDLLASNNGAIELNNCSTYATAMKKRPPPQSNGTLCNGNNANTLATTCLDSKLIALSEGKLSQEQTINGQSQSNGDSGNGETVHYFQTPYALSRLQPRPCNGQQSNSTEDHLNCLEMESTNGNTMNGCMNGCGSNQGSATLRPHHHRTNGDHVYDMPFPPKWV